MPLGSFAETRTLRSTARVCRFLEKVRPLDVTEKGSTLLLALAARYPHPGESIPWSDLHLQHQLFKLRMAEGVPPYPPALLLKNILEPLEYLGLCGCRDETELEWIAENYLEARGYLQQGPAEAFQEISLAGWNAISTLRASNTSSTSAFIAMPFAERFLPLYEKAIHPGIYNAGYDPVRIDRQEHNNRIDDEIIASIRKSRFVVADLSMHRGGIYFEAGYALGLGLPVVWTVEQTALDQNEVHFDNRQYNFLVWNDGEYDDLARRLTNRIEATIGRPA
jgi:nucleoside 2-deoxyribosyltransferase